MTAFQLSPPSRRRLLAVAKGSLEAHLLGTPFSCEEEQDPELQQERGAFVTLRRQTDGQLRGCVGVTEPREPLVRLVAQTAVAAATADGRFKPVALSELPGLRLEISVLSPLFAVKPEDVEVGVHGLIVRLGGRGGLLLPQVAAERSWDREAFLAWTCRKAGLSPETWRNADCTILAFTAIVFGDDQDETAPVFR